MDSLISTDRCDRCGAQAYVRFNRYVKSTDKYQELDFCGHHTTQYGDPLDSQGWSISVDTRELLTRRAVGAEVG
jgi:hypothetical protein